jgi:regulator of replication initiation timing
VLVNDEDETDQLRRENEKMRAELIEYQECGYVALEIENKTLRAENERLRGALEKIARGNKNEPMPDPSVIAKQALKEG